MPNNKNSLTKKALYALAIFSFLTTITNCGCVNPTSPKPTIDPDMKSNENIFVFPENSITIKKFVNLNIMDTLRPGSNYTPNDVSIAFSPGVDMLIADTNNLNIDVANGTISGSLKLKQRLDCENPIDDNVDNDYVIATFNMVDNGNTINDELKLIVRITDVEIEVTKVEILIDKFHLPNGNVLRGIKELYLYEDSNALDPSSGDDPGNFLSADIIASTTVIGEVYPGSDIKKLYDKDDVNDGFLIDTANTNMSNVYHRLTFDFNEKVNLKKIAIRGRQMGGYQGFYFIIRDESNHILYVQRANVKASGTDATATSTYSFVPSYRLSRYPISDFDIRKKNNNFNLYENSTNFFLIDNLHVTMGYEYERGFVKFSIPGADIEKFNTNNLFFIYNQLMGLSLKNPPDFEMPDDADNNNIYELGTITITNVDGGRIDFPLSVRTLDVPSTVVLKTNALGQNAVSLTVDIYTSNVIENLLEYVDFVALRIDPSMAGDLVYNYEITGDDAIYFKTFRNTLKTASDFGFRNVYESGGEYNLDVHYIPEGSIRQTLNVTVTMAEPQWREITPSPLWAGRSSFQAVVLTNNNLLVMGGYGGWGSSSPIFLSKDGGENWQNITPTSGYWSHRASFQAVVSANNDILVTGGHVGSSSAHGGATYANDMWISRDGGLNWSDITPTNSRWSYQFVFPSIQYRKAVVLTNNDILVIESDLENRPSPAAPYYNTNDNIWRSSDGGNSWAIIRSDPWRALADVAFPFLPGGSNYHSDHFALEEAMVLTNNDILVMGRWRRGYSSNRLSLNIWRSSDGGSNWSSITNAVPWDAEISFQAVVLPNNDILLMGGWGGVGSNFVAYNDIWRSIDGGTNWTDITPANHWSPRYSFQAIFLPNRGTLVLGHSDIWVREEYNRYYYEN